MSRFPTGTYGLGPVINNTADYTAVNTDCYGGIFSNKGDAGVQTVALPPALIGMSFWVYVGAAFALRLDPNGTETIELPSSGAQGAAGKYLEADAIGEWAYFRCVTAGTWNCYGFAGTWTHEA